jgi:GDPmannose 4,6-dehydratase
VKRALIFGITGQDGSYLSRLLLERGYEVHGVIRRSSTFNTDRIDDLYVDPHDPDNQLYLHFGDLADASALRGILESVCADEVYNLAAQSHVRVSFDQPEYTADIDATGTVRILEALRSVYGTGRTARFYQACSSEMFGSTPPPQNEHTAFYPRSPYAVSKIASYWYCVNYREAYDMFIANGILFNHESPCRGETFVTRKITRALTRMKFGLQTKLYLGNLDAKRDWGFAGDYVEAMWLMLQQDRPDDYVIATGEAHTVRDFLDTAAERLDLDWRRYVELDPRYLRRTEVDHLLGDARKARRALGWRPKCGFRELVTMMVDADLKLASREALLLKNGHVVPARGVAAS